MKIRTSSQVIDALDSEVAWRRRELSALRSEIRSRTGLTQAMLLRAGTALIYAHLEGFLKGSLETYISFVSRRGLKYEELSTPFMALCLRSALARAQQSGAPVPAIEVVDFLRTEMAEPSRIPRKDSVDTESNVSWKVLARLLQLVGLDYERHELRQNLLDEELLARRNAIAHGRYLDVGVDEFQQVYDTVLTLIEDVRNQLIEHVLQKKYSNHTA